MFALPEHWIVCGEHKDEIRLKKEIGLVTGTEMTIARGKVWFNQETVTGDVTTIRQIANLLHEANAIAALQRLNLS